MARFIREDGSFRLSEIMCAAHKAARPIGSRWFRFELKKIWRAARSERAIWNEARRPKHPVELAIGTRFIASDAKAAAILAYDAGRPAYLSRGSQACWDGDVIAMEFGLQAAIDYFAGQPLAAIEERFGAGGHILVDTANKVMSLLEPINEAARWEMASLTQMKLAA